jgi:hypothetical protein
MFHRKIKTLYAYIISIILMYNFGIYAQNYQNDICQQHYFFKNNKFEIDVNSPILYKNGKTIEVCTKFINLSNDTVLCFGGIGLIYLDNKAIILNFGGEFESGVEFSVKLNKVAPSDTITMKTNLGPEQVEKLLKAEHNFYIHLSFGYISKIDRGKLTHYAAQFKTKESKNEMTLSSIVVENLLYKLKLLCFGIRIE